MIRPTLIDLNPVELNFYPFMIILDKCHRNCKIIDNLSIKICVASKIKDVNVKAFNMISRIKVPYDCEWKFDSKTYS